MNKITSLIVVLFAMFASWQLNAQGLCGQIQTSNDTENALYDEVGGQEVASDLLLVQNTTSFTLDSIQASIFTNADGLASVDIKFFQDDAVDANGNPIPGTQIGSTITGLVPSNVEYVTNAFSMVDNLYTFVLPTPQVFTGSDTEDTHYWVQLIVHPVTPDPTDFQNAAIEVRTNNRIGYYDAFNNANVTGWTNDEAGEFDSVISFYGECAYSGCVAPSAGFEVIADCATGPQFLVAVNLVGLGGASSVLISDNVGSPTQTVSTPGTYTFGPYPNGAQVNITIENVDDASCSTQSGFLTQEYCSAYIVNCDGGPVNTTFCYANSETIQITYTSSDPNGALNLTVNSGTVENNFDEFIVLDSDGTELYNGYGAGGNLAGLTFQSSGATLTVQVVGDGSNSCASGAETPIDLMVSCATCVFPDYIIIQDCDTDMQTFTVDVQVTDLGSASTLILSDDQGTTPITVSGPGDFMMGPYPFGMDITFTVANSDDPNCTTTKTLSSADCPPCATADPFCANDDYDFPNTTNTGQPPDGINFNNGCFGSQPNPVWYFLQIENPGPIEITIDQTNASGTGLDVDFSMWGPFTDLASGCAQVMAGVAPIQFSYSASSTETIGIGTLGGGVLTCDGTSTPPVGQQGDVYIVMLTNYSNQPGSMTLTQDNEGDPGAGTTNCALVDQNQVLACEGDDVELVSANPGQLAYVWYRYDPSNPNADANGFVILSESSDTLTPTESAKYKLESFDSNGMITTEIFNVVISPHPDLGNLPAQTSLCGASSITLDATPTNAVAFGTITYQWSDANGPIAGETAATLDVTQTGTYSVEVTGTILDLNGLETASTCTTTQQVDVADASFTVSLGDDQVFCDMDSFDLTATITGEDPAGAAYQWTGPNGAISQTTQTITVSETGDYTVEVNIDGCAATDTVHLEFDHSPIFDLGDDLITCSLDSLVIDATPTNLDVANVTFEWDYNGNPIPETGPTVDAADHGYGTYTVTAYGNNPDCEATQSITISERSDLGVSVTSDNPVAKDIRFCPSDGSGTDYNVNLPYTVNFTATLQNASADEVVFNWYKDGQAIAGAHASTYSVTYDSQGDYDATYTVEAVLGGCSVTADITMNLSIQPYEHPCKISQGLSPDGDQYNQSLDLTFLSDRSGISKLEVYNRYGTKVYSQDNYVDQWHGQDDDGNELGTGTYYYILEMKNEDPVFGKLKKGWIYINQKIN